MLKEIPYTVNAFNTVIPIMYLKNFISNFLVYTFDVVPITSNDRFVTNGEHTFVKRDNRKRWLTTKFYIDTLPYKRLYFVAGKP